MILNGKYLCRKISKNYFRDDVYDIKGQKELW